MKKQIFSLGVAAVLLGGSVLSCSKFDEYNENPYALYDSPAEGFVQPVLYNTESQLVNSHYSTFSHLVQYTVNVTTEITSRVVHNYAIAENTTRALWQGLYPQAGNVEYMLKVAEKEANPAMKGVALVLKALIYSVLTDAYGNVPYVEAAKIATMGNDFKYTTAYNDQKSIYQDLCALLEEANDCFVRAEGMVANGELQSADFSSICDYTYRGSANHWRRFGNSLYLRLLLRVSLKTIEEDGGVLFLGDDWGGVDVRARIAEMYDCWRTGSGNYPVMRDRSDAALVPFSATTPALFTPFYSITSGNWGATRACLTLSEPLNDNGAGVADPRLLHYFAKKLGAPTQWLYQDLQEYMDTKISSAGNSLVGRIPTTIKLADHYALMNYSELLFDFAEAAARGWIPMAFPAIRSLFVSAVTESVFEWAPELTADSPELTQFLPGVTASIDADNTLEKIMFQKWISLYFVGSEGWSEYRRTGFPILKTNGPAAENDCILPTRLRYPSDELYRNEAAYNEALAGWLGGTNNMQTDVWWADTAESRANRLKGRQ